MELADSEEPKRSASAKEQKSCFQVDLQGRSITVDVVRALVR